MYEKRSDADQAFLTRFQAFRICEPIEWFDLTVPQGADLELSHRSARVNRVVRRMRLESLEDIQRWLGVPPNTEPSDYRPRAVPSFFAPPERLSPEHRCAHEIAIAAMLGHSSEVGAEEQALVGRWLSEAKVEVQIAFLHDIVVRKGSTLWVGTQGLFARYITVERGGQIVFPGGSHRKISCSGIQRTLGLASLVGTEILHNVRLGGN